MADRLAFMTPQHHRVRDFVVRELPRRVAAIPPADIAARLRMTAARVARILDDLERNLFFLVRDRRGAVEWAFPVTVARTPHRLEFSSGERGYGA